VTGWSTVLFQSLGELADGRLDLLTGEGVARELGVQEEGADIPDDEDGEDDHRHRKDLTRLLQRARPGGNGERGHAALPVPYLPHAEGDASGGETK